MIRDLRKSFGDNEVLRGIDLHIPAGQFVAIVGRSGPAARTRLLRLIAGLESIDTGTVGFGEQLRRMDVRVMFQGRGCCRGRGCWRISRSVSAAKRKLPGLGRAENALAEVGLSDMSAEWPAVLSGGPKQRVAQQPARWSQSAPAGLR